nr:hypothetical protein [Tanacetum cinerariifolium]
NNKFHRNSAHIPFPTKLKDTLVPNGLPETAASIAVAATFVDAAATLLVRRTKSIEKPRLFQQEHVTIVAVQGYVPNAKVKDLR